MQPPLAQFLTMQLGVSAGKAASSSLPGRWGWVVLNQSVNGSLCMGQIAVVSLGNRCIVKGRRSTVDEWLSLSERYSANNCRCGTPEWRLVEAGLITNLFSLN